MARRIVKLLYTPVDQLVQPLESGRSVRGLNVGLLFRVRAQHGKRCGRRLPRRLPALAAVKVSVRALDLLRDPCHAVRRIAQRLQSAEPLHAAQPPIAHDDLTARAVVQL